MSGQIDQTYGFGPSTYQGRRTTVRIVVENDGRPITASEMTEFASLAKAAEDYIAAIGAS